MYYKPDYGKVDYSFKESGEYDKLYKKYFEAEK